MKLYSYNYIARVWYKNWGWFCDIAHLIFLGSKITADRDCSHEIKRHLILGRKAMINLARVLKNRAVTLPAKVCLAKAMVFPVVMCWCESWTTNKAENWRTDAFKLWCWRKLLRVPWTARRSNQSMLKEINSEYSFKDWCWSWSANTLATWCEKLTHWKRLWCWERLKAGEEVGNRQWDGWMASLTQWTWVWANSRRWWRTGKPGAAVHEVAKSQTQLSKLNNNNSHFIGEQMHWWPR